MAEKYDAVQLDTAAQKMYENLIALYSLEGAQHIVVQMDLLVSQERRRRAKLEAKRNEQSRKEKNLSTE